MSRERHSSQGSDSRRRSVASDADIALRRGIGLGAILIAVLIAGLWLVVRGLS